jgi:hypothetical protein
VKVVVRVRPPIEEDEPLAYFINEKDQTKLLSIPLDVGVCSGGTTAREITSMDEYGFSRVISPQEGNMQTFNALGLGELIDGVGRGFQETIFAYGQTGSGKTHTILGSEEAVLEDVTNLEDGGSSFAKKSSGDPGLLQLCTRDLFNKVFNNSDEKEGRRYIQLMCVEIKNEDVIDLLAPMLGYREMTSSAGGDRVTETISIKGRRTQYNKVSVWSYDETMWLLREAIGSREVGTSFVNSESSRSHMIVRFFVKTVPSGVRPGSSGQDTGVIGTLTLVDLAGNERESQIDCANSKAINVSLTHLNRMLLKMQDGQLDESDRRQSALNMILFDTLREDCGVNMIFCIHPDQRFAASARSTLQMAMRCRRIVLHKRIRQIEPVGVNLPSEASSMAYLEQLCGMVLQGRLEPQLRVQSVESALKIARRHSHSPKILRDAAKLLAEIGNNDTTMNEEIIARGATTWAIETLHSLLSSLASENVPQESIIDSAPDENSVSLAAACAAFLRLLSVLYQGHQDHQSTSRSALDVVLRCLAASELTKNCTVNVIPRACWLIMALVHKRPENQEFIRTRDGIMLLLQLLDAEVAATEMESVQASLDTTRVVEQSSALKSYFLAGCLAKVAENNEENKQAMYEVGAIDLLLCTLRTCLQSSRVVANACVAIAHIARRHEASQHAARSQGGIPLILGALLAYRGDPSVQTSVCRAVATLTERNIPNQRAFLAERLPDGSRSIGVLALLVEALSFKPSEEPLVATLCHPCWALSNLIEGSVEALDQVRVLGGPEVVVGLLKKCAKDERACEYLCLLLDRLMQGDSSVAHRNRLKLQALGALDAITGMVQHHAQTDGYVLMRARDAMRNLNRA